MACTVNLRAMCCSRKTTRGHKLNHSNNLRFPVSLLYFNEQAACGYHKNRAFGFHPLSGKYLFELGQLFSVLTDATSLAH